MNQAQGWVALAIGNSRLHWGKFSGSKLQQTWETAHGVAATALGREAPLWIASVVPEQTAYWLTYPHAHVLRLQDVPLQGLYPTLGIDRALALWGAASRYGLPALVLDAGTALTLTGADAEGGLVGGAILPGLSLQFRSLAQTAALPSLSPQEFWTLPTRWTTNTTEAIGSGILYTLLAGIQDFITSWKQQFPDSSIVFTGGDSTQIHTLFQQFDATFSAEIIQDQNLVLWGIQAIVTG